MRSSFLILFAVLTIAATMLLSLILSALAVFTYAITGGVNV